MDAIGILGFVAGFLITFANVPQVVKVWKTKQTHDISLWMYILLSVGMFLWTVYGILKNDLPLIFTYSISFILIFSILIHKLKYK